MIAILLATYNGGKYIKQQIDSIKNQTCKDWKLYIRDDGSTDDTLKIISEYTRTDSRIILIRDNIGSLGTRDQFLHLLKIVDAEYYMFCDQDDVWFPDKIEKSVTRIKEIEQNYPNEAVLVGSDCMMCGPDLEIINKSCWEHLRINPKQFLNINGICVYPFVTGASMILNRKARDIIPAIPAGLSKNRPMYDWWVLIQIYKKGIVDLLYEPTRYYRQHANNVSGGIDKLDNSYLHKLKHIPKIIKANKVRAKVLKAIGYKPTIKYWFFKLIYLSKMMRYKTRNNAK